MSLLETCEILGLFVNILTADDKYHLCYSESLPETIHMQLLKKLKIFSKLVAAFLKSTSNFENFEKKDHIHY